MRFRSRPSTWLARLTKRSKKRKNEGGRLGRAMLPESIELIIVTPERQLLRETVVEVTLPGAGGCLGILPGHAPLITELGIGALTYRVKSASEPVHLAIISGFAEVLGDRVTVLAETAERPEEIDVARAEEAKKRAEQRLAS